MRTLPLFSLLAAVSCVLWPQSRPYPVQLSARLNASSPSDLDQQLRAAFAGGVAHPANTHNCMELLALGTRNGKAAGGARDSLEPREYLQQRSTLAQCAILQELHNATAARSSFVDKLNWDQSVWPLLPPQLAIDVSNEKISAAMTAAAAGKSWADIDPSASAGADGPDRVMVRGDGFIVRLILWGRGDLNADGVQDLLVQTLDTLTEGTYRYTRLYILTRKTAGGKLSVVRELL